MRAEAAKTKIETTQCSIGRLNAIKEDIDFSEAAEEFNSESEEDLHGATDDKPRESTIFDACSLKGRSTDLRRRASASFTTSLSTAQIEGTRRTT
jgi:hypothetical protein